MNWRGPSCDDLRVVMALAELIVGPGDAGTAGEQVILFGELHQHAFAHDLAGVVAEDDVLGLPDIEFGETVDRDGGEEPQGVAALDAHLCRVVTSRRYRACPSTTCSRRSSRCIPTARSSRRTACRCAPCAQAAVRRRGAGSPCCLRCTVMIAAEPLRWWRRRRRGHAADDGCRAYSSIMSSMVDERGSAAVGDHRIAQAEQRQRRELRIEIGAQLAACDALRRTTARSDPDRSAPVRRPSAAARPAIRGGDGERRRCSPRPDGCGAARDGWRSRRAACPPPAIGSAMIACRLRDEVLDAELADGGERGLLRRKVVIEAGLPNAEPLGDVARAGAGIAFFGEHRRGRVEHLAIAALPTRRRLPSGGACAGVDIRAHFLSNDRKKATPKMPAQGHFHRKRHVRVSSRRPVHAWSTSRMRVLRMRTLHDRRAVPSGRLVGPRLALSRTKRC